MKVYSVKTQFCRQTEETRIIFLKKVRAKKEKEKELKKLWQAYISTFMH